jgi:hypothetical protein
MYLKLFAGAHTYLVLRLLPRLQPNLCTVVEDEDDPFIDFKNLSASHPQLYGLDCCEGSISQLLTLGAGRKPEPWETA